MLGLESLRPLRFPEDLSCQPLLPADFVSYHASAPDSSNHRRRAGLEANAFRRCRLPR